MNWTAKDIPSQTGRRAVITGANSGIGFFTALELARNGAEVILPARTMEKANGAIQRIREQIPGAKLTPAVMDLASLASVRAFVAYYAENFPGSSLGLLINNAGIMGLPRRELTVDGYERQFATNVLGHFALTALLFPHLKPEAGTRIVTIASLVAKAGKIEFDNLNGERKYAGLTAVYSQTKLADLIFALELQRRLTAAGSPIASIAAHPGIAATNLASSFGGVFKILGGLMMTLVCQPAAAGALPTLFAATAPAAAPGGYYGPNGAGERKGYPVAAKIPETAKDVAVSQRLWAEAERMTGATWPALDAVAT